MPGFVENPNSNPIFQRIRDSVKSLSNFGLRYGGEIRPFPTKREDYEFVGDVFDINEVRHPEYWKIIKNIIG